MQNLTVRAPIMIIPSHLCRRGQRRQSRGSRILQSSCRLHAVASCRVCCKRSRRCKQGTPLDHPAGSWRICYHPSCRCLGRVHSSSSLSHTCKYSDLCHKAHRPLSHTCKFDCLSVHITCLPQNLLRLSFSIECLCGSDWNKCVHTTFCRHLFHTRKMIAINFIGYSFPNDLSMFTGVTWRAKHNKTKF